MKTIARYRLERQIGRGQMGVVYLAQDPRLNRQVAIKICGLPDGAPAAEIDEYHTRFLREGRAAAALAHPGIVTVFDAEVDAERRLPFIAMEYVEGSTLRELLSEQGRLDPRRAISIGVSLARALHAAHKAGVVHRDLKPANILMRAIDGFPKIADFGVARLASSELTDSGSVVGSPAYMSPEQIRGQEVDGRSDLFSLASLLYETIAGRRPFAGDDLASLAYTIVHETPLPISKQAPGVPEGLDAFFHRALATDPEERFQTGDEFAEALGESEAVDGLGVTRVEGIPAMDERKPVTRRKKRGSIVAVLALMALIALGWFFLHRKPAYLILDGKSAVSVGTLTLSVDDEVIYTRDLSAPNREDGFIKKVLLKRNNETFEAWLKLRPGKHEVAVEISTGIRADDFRDTIVVDLAAGETRKLRMVAGRALGTPLTLKLERPRKRD
jgi:serine/threonine-protein kinase